MLFTLTQVLSYNFHTYTYLFALGSEPVAKETGEKLIVKFEKMSKSKHNGVNPEELLANYGPDAVRIAVLSNVPPKQDMFWDEKGEYSPPLHPCDQDTRVPACELHTRPGYINTHILPGLIHSAAEQ